MNVEKILSSLVRIGTVSSVSGKKARVIFKDHNIVSGWLYVLQHNSASVSIEGSGEHHHTDSLSGTTSTNSDHSHAASVTHWMPSINERVLCLYLPVDDGDGFVLGAIK